MSGLQARTEDPINGVDVREQGSALRVATNTPHLVSLGTGRLSTAVTLHPIKQGRVTIGSDPTCDIYVVGTGVASVHCRVENSHGVVTLYPLSGSTLLDGLPVDKPTRLSQGSMLTIGRSNYLRFNHPAEAKLMKSVLPSAHVSMAPVQFTPNDQCYVNHEAYQTAAYQKIYKDNSLTQLDQELDMTLREISRQKPPLVPKKPHFEDSSSDQETRKQTSIMAKVSKFEYYAKQQKIGRSQFYTSNENEISPKVFSANSLTVNTPARDVLGGKAVPNYMKLNKDVKTISLTENNTIDPKNCSYANVAIRNKTKIDDIVKNFSEKDYNLPKKVNNDQQNDNVYGKINVDRKSEEKSNNLMESGRNLTDQGRNFTDPGRNMTDPGRNYTDSGRNMMDPGRNLTDPGRNMTDPGRNFTDPGRNMTDPGRNLMESGKNNLELGELNEAYGRLCVGVSKGACLPSPAYDRNPQYSPVYANSGYDRSMEAESRRLRAYQDRVKEEEQKEAETARLEEILTMCAEYERQIASGIPITPTEKRPHNKIITNGSLPRSVASNNPNFVQTSDGYFKFDTSQERNSPLSKSLPLQRNLSSYENFDSSPPTELTPEVTISSNNYENVGRMDEIGIPVFDEPTSTHELSSPIMIRKLNQNETISPVTSPYENVYYRNNYLKPKSPKTQSPRTRIKTSFAHKNLPSPQYFVFPTPPPKDNEPNFDNVKVENPNFGGIEKQLSLEEEIPMAAASPSVHPF